MSYSSQPPRRFVINPRANTGWYLNTGRDWPSDPHANPWRNSAYIVEPVRQFPRPMWDHAAPLSAIPGRDLQELEDCFDRGDMPEVEADVNHLLAQLFPEPAWDDDAWAFLRECEAQHPAQKFQPPPSVGIGHRFDAYL